MKKIIAVIAFLCGALGLTVVLDRPSPPADFSFIQIFDFNTLDPQRMSYLQDLRMCYTVYEGLGRWDNDHPEFKVVPAAAESWDISEDQRTYTFHIRDNARWSNGDPVTAHDFEYAWQRAMLPETAADYSNLFFRIKGAEEYFNWRSDQLEAYAELNEQQKIERFGLEDATDENGDPLTRDRKLQRAARALREESNRYYEENVGVDALDARTLKVTLERPTPYFLDLVAFGPFHPVHPPTVEEFVSLDPDTGRIKQDHGWTKPRHCVYNGPYVVTQWRFKRDMRLEPNPEYEGPAVQNSDSIKVITIEDQNTSTLAFLTGAADWNSSITVGYIDEMLRKKKKGEFDPIHKYSTFGTYFWSFNCTDTLTDGSPNPFRDPAVRRAFAQAVDKKAIVEKVKKTGEKVSNVFIPRGSIGGFDSPDGLSYDPQRAQEELKNAGWVDRDDDGIPENEDGREFPTVELLCSSGSYHDDVALAMGRMWEETLGIRSSIAIRETKVYRDNLKNRDYMMARGGWYGDYGDPTTFLDLHKTGDGNNDRGYSDPHFDELLRKANNETDPEKRMEILEEAERYTMEETLPILPIWQYNYYYLYWPPTHDDGTPREGGLKNITDHPRLVQYLWELEVVE